jgi:hypothetical protein
MHSCAVVAQSQQPPQGTPQPAGTCRRSPVAGPRPPRLQAAARGHAACIDSLYKDGGADLHYRNELADDEHALLLAAAAGAAPAVRQLLHLGAKANQCDAWGRSALWSAAERGDAAVVDLLLAQRPAPKHIRDYVRRLTPLGVAQVNGHHAVARKLAAALAAPVVLEGE